MVARSTYAIIIIIGVVAGASCCPPDRSRIEGKLSRFDRQIINFVDRSLSVDEYDFGPVRIQRSEDGSGCGQDEGRSLSSLEDYVRDKFEDYVRTHSITFKVPATPRFFGATGSSSFLTGFGLGFLAFGLKKLLLPLFIAGQIFKSVLIAMFLPSILGSFGKLLGKGLSQVSSVSGSSGHQQQQIEDFEFKDTTSYNTDGNVQDLSDDNTITLGNAAGVADLKQTNSRYGQGGSTYNRVTFLQPQSDSYYIRAPAKQHDFKVFHKIPSSSLLLTTYDPFYSPLLSRLDAVFQQLGLGDGKGAGIEKCRERLVCLMYANPAKYAPYSNLVSAQLSRELNELRKPSSDNPEILRFFRYMRAAKDGQDDGQCLAHNGCPSLQPDKPSPAMLTTYNDINKLVQARQLNS